MNKRILCSVRSCKRRAATEGVCRTHQTQRRDRQFSLDIRARDGACRKCQAIEKLQCAHIVSRRYRRTRWDDENAIALCSADHVYFTHRPLEWEQYVDELFGEGHMLKMKHRALGIAE